MDLIRTYENNYNDNDNFTSNEYNNYHSPALFNSTMNTYTNTNTLSDTTYNTYSYTSDELSDNDTIHPINDALLSAIRTLENTIDFMKTEIEEKNLLIKALIFQEANEGRKFDPLLLEPEIIQSAVPSNVSNDNLEESVDEISSKLYEDISDTSCSFSKSDDLAPWELYSTGFGSKILNKLGYNGGGLGKNENGIVKPISISSGMKHFSLDNTTTNKKRRVNNNVHCWPKGTTLITGSSIIMGIEESRLRKYKAKVRPFPGACIDDLYDYLEPLLKKKPTNMILQIGSNDATFKSASQILNEIINLKVYIEHMVPGITIYLSSPVVRFDNKTANSTLRELGMLFENFNNIIFNDNIDSSCIGKKGLHLNPRGSGRLAINFISVMRRL